MGLREAVAFLKRVPDNTRDSYAFADGWAYARGAAMLGAYPVPHMLGTFGISASDLNSAVERMGTEPRVEAGDGTLVLRRGRLRSSIDLVDEPPPSDPLHGSDVAPEPIPDGFLAAIATVLPFVAAEGTWQRTVELAPGRIRAIDRSHGVSVDVPALALDSPIGLTDDAARYLVARDAPIAWRRLESAVAFFFTGGAWLLCNLPAYSWPTLADSVFGRAGGEVPVVITEEWREAFADVAALGDGHVDVSPSSIVGRTLHAEHTAEFDTGAETVTRWSISALGDVVRIANAWGPDSKDGRAAFRGPNLCGILAAMRTEG